MHSLSDTSNSGCQTCSLGYVRAVGTVTRLLEGEDRGLQGLKTNYICNVEFCQVQHAANDSDSGCSQCEWGYNRIPANNRFLQSENELRTLQSQKTEYVCESSILNCAGFHPQNDTDSGCRRCKSGFGRKVGTAPGRILEGSQRTLQAAAPKIYYVCEACAVADCMDCSTTLHTSCLTCKTRILEANLWDYQA